MLWTAITNARFPTAGRDSRPFWTRSNPSWPAPRAVRHWEDGAAKMVAFRDPARSGRGCPPSLAQSAHRKRGKLPYAARQNPMASVLAGPNLCPAEDGRLATLHLKLSIGAQRHSGLCPPFACFRVIARPACPFLLPALQHPHTPPPPHQR